MKQFKSQSGRSMVEMLGVLAVIGVLSIGGIMGYSYGMDKYRANETTNQIMLRAIDLMTQASNNNADLSLAGWSNETSQYDFANEDYTEDGLIAFDMGINNPLPKSVCEMVYDGMSSMAVQIDINAVRADSNDACAEENEMTFYFEGQIGTRCIPECAENEYCYNGICFKGGVPERTPYVSGKECTSKDDCNTDWTGTCSGWCVDNKCYGNSAYNGDPCTIKEGNIPGQCNMGICVPKGCITNADCTEPGTYCASTNSSTEVRFQSGETGSCVSLDFVRKEFGGETYYISNTLMSWWDAEYACDAIGSNVKMISANDLLIGWNGDREPYTKTELAKEFNKFMYEFCVWTGDPCPSSGDAFELCLTQPRNEGQTYNNDRNSDNYFFAVCK